MGTILKDHRVTRRRVITLLIVSHLTEVHRHQEPHIYLVWSEESRVLVWFYVWDVDVGDVFLFFVKFLELKKSIWLMLSYDFRGKGLFMAVGFLKLC